MPKHENRRDETNRPLLDFIKDCDILIHNGHFFEDTYQSSRRNRGYSSIGAAIENAVSSRAGSLFITSHDPAIPDDHIRLYLARLLNSGFLDSLASSPDPRKVLDFIDRSTYFIHMARAKKGEETRERIVQTTSELLQKKGYYGTGLNQILKDSGAPRGSLYFHFPEGKDQLVSTALQTSGESLADMIDQAFVGTPNPSAALNKVIELLSHQLEDSNYQKGCPIASSVLDGAGVSELLRQATATAYQTWTDIIVKHFMDAGIEADRARQLATIALSLIEGALILSRAYHDTGPLQEVSSYMQGILARAG